MFIQFGGIPGSGKTSIIKELEKRINVKRITGSDFLCQIAGVSHKDLRLLPEEKRSEMRPRMFELMFGEMYSEPATLWLYDGHFCFYESSSKKYGVRPISFFDQKMMKFIIVIEADPNEILERRKRNKKKRKDRVVSMNRIQLELKTERRIAIKVSNTLDKKIFFVNNSCFEKAVEEIIKIIYKYHGKDKVSSVS
jgi:adenylate kinase